MIFTKHTEADVLIREEGAFEMEASAYHHDPCFAPSLSSSGALTLIEQTPRHAQRAHPRLWPPAPEKRDAAMDLGSVAHELLLGKGGGIVVLDFADWRTKAAQFAREEAAAAGTTPILHAAYQGALRIANAVRERLAAVPGCEDTLDVMFGRPEAVLIWQDIGGPWCRCMMDWLDLNEVSATATISDIKTTAAGLSDRQLAARIAGGLDLRAAFYMRGLEKLRPDLAGRIRFRWIFVETEEPFECRVVEMDNTARVIGDKKAAFAIEVWRRCIEADYWPGYPARIETLGYPAFAENNWLEREMREEEISMAAVPSYRAAINTSRQMLPEFVP